jgi:hypothetical protein
MLRPVHATPYVHVDLSRRAMLGGAVAVASTLCLPAPAVAGRGGGAWQTGALDVGARAGALESYTSALPRGDMATEALMRQAAELGAEIGAKSHVVERFVRIAVGAAEVLGDAAAILAPFPWTGVRVVASVVQAANKFLSPHLTKADAFQVSDSVFDAGVFLRQAWGRSARRQADGEPYTVPVAGAKIDAWPSRYPGGSEIPGVYHVCDRGIVFVSSDFVMDGELGVTGVLVGMQSPDFEPNAWVISGMMPAGKGFVY